MMIYIFLNGLPKKVSNFFLTLSHVIHGNWKNPYSSTRQRLFFHTLYTRNNNLFHMITLEKQAKIEAENWFTGFLEKAFDKGSRIVRSGKVKEIPIGFINGFLGDVYY